MSICDALEKTGRTFTKHKGLFGLEIETESDAEYRIPEFAFWDIHADGSLRGFGREYVLRQPLDFDVIPQALEEFKSKLVHANFKKNSITTSVHVHVNMLNESFPSFGNFLTTYALVENLLIKYSGEGRNGNMFCLPMCDAEETYKNIVNMLKNLSTVKGKSQPNYQHMLFDRELTKYAALNLHSLSNFGSLEVRSFRGTTDIKEIEDWVGILHEIVKFSRQDKMYPGDIINNYKDKGVELLTDIFGKYRKNLKFDDEAKLIENNFWYAANIALSVPDSKGWDKLDAVQKPKKVKSSDLDTIARQLYNRPFEELRGIEQLAVLRQGGDVEIPQAEFDDGDAAIRPWEAEEQRIRDLALRAAARPIPVRQARGDILGGVVNQPVVNDPWRNND